MQDDEPDGELRVGPNWNDEFQIKQEATLAGRMRAKAVSLIQAGALKEYNDGNLRLPRVVRLVHDKAEGLNPYWITQLIQLPLMTGDIHLVHALEAAASEQRLALRDLLSSQEEVIAFAKSWLQNCMVQAKSLENWVIEKFRAEIITPKYRYD